MESFFNSMRTCFLVTVGIVCFLLLTVIWCIPYGLPMLWGYMSHTPFYIQTGHNISATYDHVAAFCVAVWGLRYWLLASGIALFLTIKIKPYSPETWIKIADIYAKVIEVRANAQLRLAEAYHMRSQADELHIGETENGIVMIDRFSGAIINKIGKAIKAKQERDIEVPTFLELLQEGPLKDGQVLVGVDAGNGKLVSYESKYEVSGTILGGSGSGKSNELAAKVLDALRWVYSPIIIDPHHGVNMDIDEEEGEEAPQTLVARLGKCAAFCTIVSDTPQDVASFPEKKKGRGSKDKVVEVHSPIIDAVRAYVAEIDERKASKKPKGGWNPKLLVIDELFDLLLSHAAYKELVPLLIKIGIDGRKFRMYLWVGCQQVKADALGSTSLRQCLPSYFCLRVPQQEARLLVGESQGTKKLLSMVPDMLPGEAFFDGLKIKQKHVFLPFVAEKPQELDMIAQLISAIRMNKWGSGSCLPKQEPVNEGLYDGIPYDDIPYADDIPDATSIQGYGQVPSAYPSTGEVGKWLSTSTSQDHTVARVSTPLSSQGTGERVSTSSTLQAPSSQVISSGDTSRISCDLSQLTPARRRVYEASVRLKSVSPTMLANELKIDKSTVHQHLKALRSMGYIR